MRLAAPSQPKRPPPPSSAPLPSTTPTSAGPPATSASGEPVIVLRGSFLPATSANETLPISATADRGVAAGLGSQALGLGGGAAAAGAGPGAAGGAGKGMVIPDAKAIAAAKAKRERLRQAAAAPDFIPVPGGGLAVWQAAQELGGVPMRCLGASPVRSVERGAWL